MAAILKDFAKENEWVLLGVSIDGKELVGINTLHEKEKLRDKFKVSYVPGILAVNFETDEAKPIGWGVVTYHQLEENIFEQLKAQRRFRLVCRRLL